MKAILALIAITILSFGGSAMAQTAPQLSGPYVNTRQDLRQVVWANPFNGGGFGLTDGGEITTFVGTITFDPSAGTYHADEIRVNGALAACKYTSCGDSALTQTEVTRDGTYSITSTVLTMDGVTYPMVMASMDIITGIVAKMSYSGVDPPPSATGGYTSKIGTLERIGDTQLPPAAGLP